MEENINVIRRIGKYKKEKNQSILVKLTKEDTTVMIQEIINNKKYKKFEI